MWDINQLNNDPHPGNAGSQRDSELETVSKLKALLVRNKKELVEGRKKEAELSEKVNQLEAELEKGRGQEEETKVSQCILCSVDKTSDI